MTDSYTSYSDLSGLLVSHGGGALGVTYLRKSGQGNDAAPHQLTPR